MNNDSLTTILGVLMGALTAAQIDTAKLAALDRAELVKAGMAVGMALLGYFTNKTAPKPAA